MYMSYIGAGSEFPGVPLRGRHWAPRTALRANRLISLSATLPVSLIRLYIRSFTTGFSYVVCITRGVMVNIEPGDRVRPQPLRESNTSPCSTTVQRQNAIYLKSIYKLSGDVETGIWLVWGGGGVGGIRI